LIKDELQRPSACCVTIEDTSVMLADAAFQAVARCADVIRAVGTAEDVKVSAHAARPVTARSISASKLAAMA
jgi:hypothetical protein